MKRHTSYPTTHPHWIDTDDEPETMKSKFGITFKAAFAIVLALHMVGIGGIYVYSKSNSKMPVIAKTAARAEAGPKSDALASNAWPEPEAQAKVVATPPPVEKQVAASKPAIDPVNKPESVVAAKATPAAAPVAAKSTAVAVKGNNPPATIAKAPAPVAPSPADQSALKEAFLAARGNSQPVVESRRAIPVTRDVQPLVATNNDLRVETVPAQAPVSAAPSTHQSPSISSASANREQQRSTPRPSEYTLAPGDNLYTVSRRLQVSYNDLMQANGLSDPRQLRVGQKLKVPAEHMASL